jgi:hypothetical protein
MTTRQLLVLLLLAVSQLTFADEPMLGPAIEGYGPTFPIADRDIPLAEGAVYRAVFDAARELTPRECRPVPQYACQK